MMMVKSAESKGPPPPELMAAVDQMAREMAQAGVLLDMGGLAPSARGARIRVSKGAVAVLDGPFTETKELIGGFAVLKAGSKAEAIELGRRFMQMHVDVLGGDFTAELEIREMADPPAADAAGHSGG
jgi:hypothetical protein